MLDILKALAHGVGDMTYGDPDDADAVKAGDVVRWAVEEIAQLREELKPVAWCVQAAAGSTVHAGTHSPIDVPVLIQVKDKTEARILATVYGCKILAVIEPDEKEVHA
jgi:hypothetical protein